MTDGAGTLDSGAGPISLGQYDVFIARPDAPALSVAAATKPLRLLTFYLPRFAPR